MLDGVQRLSWNTPHPPSLRSGTFSHRGRRGDRFTAAGNHHRSRLTEALISRLSFSPCGRRWPSRSEAPARSDEGCWTERGAPSWNTPHPPSLRSGTFSHTGRRGDRFTAAGNHHRSRLTEALISRLSFSPCGRRWPSRSEAQARSDEGCWTECSAPSWNIPSSVSAPSTGMRKKTKFLYPPPFRLSHNLRHRPHGNLVRTGYQGGRRCRAGRVAETRLEIFIRGPGPLRGSPAPAEATAGAPTIGQDHRRGAGKAPYIYFTRH